MHLHASALDFLVIAAYLIIFGFLWRYVSARYADKPLGQAMSTIF